MLNEPISAEKLLKKLRTKELSVYKAKNGQSIRYRNGRYELLCLTCVVDKWDPIADEYALQLADRLLKLE